MSWIAAIILAIIEGLTEFLPISSTGHMVIASAFMGINEQNFTKIFEVNIQFGAILSVVVLYWKRFFQSIDFYFKLIVAVIPAVILGYLLGDLIDAALERVWVIALNLLLGGIILLFIDKWFQKNEENNQPNNENKSEKNKDISYKTSLIIGCFQCLAMIFPGLSRSASTIVGGLTQKLTRLHAAEFSFFLAVPTMFLASAHKLLKSYQTISIEQWQILALGNLVAFVVAMLAIKFFIGFLAKYGFRWFGYYRIALGLTLLILLAMGVKLTL
ncbi:MAG: undecaprenyl-diphosphate phosphatase [Bacteroidetes bacterium]|nr:MAG: undecaprenyl-diphosphate phosphatase [Bacteroidota bacterium]TAG93396.1 MAG: undecaprenyl-diphosphate phosphatase [Bacteroidota bacterium]